MAAERAEREPPADDGGAATPDDRVISIHLHDGSDGWEDDAESLNSDAEDAELESQTKQIKVWDEDSEEEDEELPRSRRPILPFPLSGPLLPRQRRGAAARHGSPRDEPPLSQWRVLLLGSGQPGTLTMAHVALNLFSASLHPAVLLAAPVYFARAGVIPGLLGFLFCSLLGAFGGGLWVTLGRYVGGATLEIVTGTSFGMHTRWKRNMGKLLAGALVAVQCTGMAAIAYHALADLLLHVFFHYSELGDLLHDRAFVTLVVGGALTLPMLIVPLPKRALVQLASWTVVLVYPIVVALMLHRIHFWRDMGGIGHALKWLLHGVLHRPQRPEAQVAEVAGVAAEAPVYVASRLGTRVKLWPWATTSMLPVLTMSASPAQILLHNRSLQRPNLYQSNVKTFFFSQLVQMLLMILVTYLLGVEVGLLGARDVHGDLHTNFFSSFPMDDNTINVARLLFCLLLATHLSLCLATARSSWSRLLKLLHLLPRRSGSGAPATALAPGQASALSGFRLTWTGLGAFYRHRRKQLRDVLAGFVLWSITAGLAYSSGVGGFFRRSEKDGAELRFLRLIEAFGLLTVLVGILLPALNWLVMFRIRRPRAILQARTSTTMRQSMQNYLFGPLSSLMRTRRPAHPDAEAQPLLAEEEQAHEAPSHAFDPNPFMPNHVNEEDPNSRDEATLILLARKERELQRMSRHRRMLQEIVVVALILPFGLFLFFSAGIELLRGGY